MTRAAARLQRFSPTDGRPPQVTRPTVKSWVGRQAGVCPKNLGLPRAGGNKNFRHGRLREAEHRFCGVSPNTQFTRMELPAIIDDLASRADDFLVERSDRKDARAAIAASSGACGAAG